MLVVESVVEAVVIISTCSSVSTSGSGSSRTDSNSISNSGRSGVDSRGSGSISSSRSSSRSISGNNSKLLVVEIVGSRCYCTLVVAIMLSCDFPLVFHLACQYYNKAIREPFTYLNFE